MATAANGLGTANATRTEADFTDTDCEQATIPGLRRAHQGRSAALQAPQDSEPTRRGRGRQEAATTCGSSPRRYVRFSPARSVRFSSGVDTCVQCALTF